MILFDLKIFMAEKISTESPYTIPLTDKEIKNFIRMIPRSPGVYKFLDIHPKWEDGINGLIQLITLSHVNQILKKRLL